MEEKAKCKNCTEEMIEEMANIIDERLIEANNVLGSMNKGKGYWLAQKLVEYYQPKLPEGAVVLSREENENWLKWLEQNIEKARQKTAKEILQSVKLRAWGNNADVNGNIWSYSISIYELNEILKEYGVEE